MRLSYAGLPLLLCLASRSFDVQAAPAAKPQKAIKFRAVTEVERMVAAYKKLGDFSVTTDQTFKVDGTAGKFKGQANIAKDGRQSFALRGKFEGVPVQVDTFGLYDGKVLWQQDLGEPVKKSTAAQVKAQPALLKELFRFSFGPYTIATAMRSVSELFEPTNEWNGSPIVTELGEGKLRVEIRSKKPVSPGSKKEKTMNVKLSLGAEGYLEKLEMKGMVVGSKEPGFYALVHLGRPQALDAATAFDWKKLTATAPAPTPAPTPATAPTPAPAAE